MALPRVNREILYAVMELLHKVVTHADVNKMHAVNLAIVIGPNILRADVGPIEALADMDRVSLYFALCTLWSSPP